MDTGSTPNDVDRWDIVRGPRRSKTKQLRGKSRAMQAAWSKWEPRNRFEVLAEDSDSSPSSEDDDPAPTVTAASIPRDNRNHDEHKAAQDSEYAPDGNNSTEEDTNTPKKAEENPVSDEDSAIHSEEDEPRNLTFWACPFCNKPLEDLAAAIVQHIKDNHTLTNPPSPLPPPAEPNPNKVEDYQCNG